MQRALFISAGGDHAAYALGMLHVMNTQYTHVGGISAGALISAALAHNGDTRECVQQMYETLRSHTVAEPWITKQLGSVVNAVYSLLFRHSLFQNHIPTLAAPYFTTALQKTYQVGAYNTTHGQYVTFDNTSPHIRDAVVASASPPAIFTPVEIDGCKYSDGAMAHVIPVDEIKAYWKNSTGDIDVMMCYPTSSFEDFMKCEMKPGHWLSKDMQGAAYEMVWNTMQRDIRDLEETFGPLRSELRVGTRLIRFIRPLKPIYSSFTEPSKAAVDAMFQAGKDAARVQLRL